MELRRAFSLSKPLSWSRPSTRPPDLSVKPSLLRSLSLSGELSTDSMAPQRSGCLNLLVMLPEPLVPERELLPCDTVGLGSLLDLDIYTPLFSLCRKSSSPLWEPPDPVKATPTSPVPTPPEPPDPPDTTDVHRSPLAVTLLFSPPTSPPPFALPRRPSNLLLPFPSSTVISPTSAFSVGMASLRRRVVKPSHRLTTPLHLWMFPEASVTALMSDGDSSAVTLITFHLLLSQVCYSLSPAFPSVVCSRNLEDCLALVLWLPSVLLSDLKTSISRIPNLLPISGSFNALVRSITAICRVVPVFFMTGYASGYVSMWQIRRNCLGCIYPINLDLDFHSPHRSVKELFLLSSTSLVLSVIVAGSIVLKAVLFRAVNKRLFVSQSSNDIVDVLTFSSLEAFIPPLGFLDQDDLSFFDLNSTSVELARSHLSRYLYLSFCLVLYLTLSSTNLWSDALVCLALSSLLYLLLLEINS